LAAVLDAPGAAGSVAISLAWRTKARRQGRRNRIGRNFTRPAQQSATTGPARPDRSRILLSWREKARRQGRRGRIGRDFTRLAQQSATTAAGAAGSVAILLSRRNKARRQGRRSRIGRDFTRPAQQSATTAAAQPDRSQFHSPGATKRDDRAGAAGSVAISLAWRTRVRTWPAPPRPGGRRG
jgi:hypothetical protein